MEVYRGTLQKVDYGEPSFLWCIRLLEKGRAISTEMVNLTQLSEFPRNEGKSKAVLVKWAGSYVSNHAQGWLGYGEAVCVLDRLVKKWPLTRSAPGTSHSQ